MKMNLLFLIWNVTTMFYSKIRGINGLCWDYKTTRFGTPTWNCSWWQDDEDLYVVKETVYHQTSCPWFEQRCHESVIRTFCCLGCQSSHQIGQNSISLIKDIKDFISNNAQNLVQSIIQQRTLSWSWKSVGCWSFYIFLGRK